MAPELREQLQAHLGSVYTIERELGGGGMSRVFLANDVRLGRTVVVKVLPPQTAAGVSVDRFEREIHLAAKLQHPHIVPLLTAGSAGDVLYYTMPHIEGESLRSRLAHDHQLPVSETVRILRDVVDALACAHAHGIVHRDIKPDNVLLSGKHALVTDFGVAKAVTDSTGTTALTSMGVALGTPAYMAPEQAAADPNTDHRADLYAVGVLGYEMLTGRPPFTGTSPQAVLAAQVNQLPEPISKQRPGVPPALAALVMRCLEKKPADRCQTAEHLLSQLEAMATPPGGMTVPPTTSQLGRRVPLTVVLGLGFLLGLGVLFGWLRWQSPGKSERGARPQRLAVLPFEGVGDTSDRVFADGLSEELTTRLARVPGLSLVARSSALQYRRAGKTAPEFGRALGVDYVLDGTVRSAAGPTGHKELRVTPELIKVANGTHVWGEPYAGALADVFRLQSDVAERVAEALRGALGPGEQRAIRTGPTEDLEAYRLYVLGRAAWSQRTAARPERLERAGEYFREAIARDSTFARAYAGLADAYALYEIYRVRTLPRDTAYARAKAAALRALAFDSTLAEAHASLCQILRYGYWDWSCSEREVRRAITLDPDYATAHQWLAEHLLSVGRVPEGLAEARIDVQLDPLSPLANNVLGLALWYSGRTEEAIAAFRAAIARDSIPGYPFSNLFWLYVHAGRNDDARALLAARPDTSTFNQGLFALLQALSDARARTILLARLGRRGGSDAYVSHWDAATTYAALGQRDSALTELERAVAGREPLLEWIRVAPNLASVRDDPRFAAIVARMRWPP